MLNVGDEDDGFKAIAGDLEFVIINIYCQYSVNIEMFLDSLIDCIPTENLLLTLDAKAKSVLWHADKTDEKGALVEELIIAHNLTVLNQPNNPPTFTNAKGQSNINITIATAALARHVKTWKVDTFCTTSDHNLIIIELQMDIKSNKISNRDLGYNLRKANWQQFKEQVEQNFDQNATRVIGTLPADKAAMRVQQ